jgi:hypothetical protein
VAARCVLRYCEGLLRKTEPENCRQCVQGRLLTVAGPFNTHTRLHLPLLERRTAGPNVDDDVVHPPTQAGHKLRVWRRVQPCENQQCSLSVFDLHKVKNPLTKATVQKRSDMIWSCYQSGSSIWVLQSSGLGRTCRIAPRETHTCHVIPHYYHHY